MLDSRDNNAALERRTDQAATPSSGPPPRRPPLSWKKRTALIVFGLTLSLVLLEMALRLTGFVFYFGKQFTAGNYPEDAFVIMCVGDSCTFGVGATDPTRFSYPAQLQAILEARHPDRPWRVVNMGFGGANSSQMARRFEEFLRLHQPDLAIILIGHNDVWNQNESRSYLVGRGERTNFSRRARARLRLWGDRLHTVRLARCLALNLRGPGPARWNPQAHTDPSGRRYERGQQILGDIARIEYLYRMNFEEMSKAARRCGTELLWLDYHLPGWVGETDYIDPVLADLGVPHLDLAAYFQADDPLTTRTVSADYWHPNDLGYTVFARAIYNKLVDLRYVPGPPMDVLENLAVD